MLACIYLIAAWHITFSDTNLAPKSSLIGYDCSDTQAKCTVINLNAISACHSSSRVIKKEKIRVQVLQTRLYRPVHVFGCKLRIFRLAFYCGWQSYMSPKPDMIYSGIKFLNHDGCRDIHDKKIFVYGDVIHRDLKSNSTTSSQIMLAGSIDKGSNCKPVAKYIDDGGVLENVVVTGHYELTLFDAYATAVMSEDTIIISTLGISCPTKSGYCKDAQHGEIYWSFADETDCRTSTIDILYEGSGEIIDVDQQDRILSVTSESRAFALRLLGPTRLCHQDVWRTEHSRMYVAGEASLGYRFPSSGGHLYAPNIDLSAYIDSKFLYSSLAIWNSTQALVDAMRLRDCETRRMVLENRLMIARQSPDMVSLLTQGSGVYGRLLGEVLYMIQCVPVGVTFRSPSACYQEIPVDYKGKGMYLSPVTRLLVPEATEVPCKSLLHPRFMIGQKWYIRTPDLMEVPPPKMLDPNGPEDWHYEPFLHIGAGGLYSVEQLKSLQQEMMFPATREAMTTKVIRRITHTGTDSIAMTDIFTPGEINKITDLVAGKISWFFHVFGQWASTIIGIYVIGKFVIYLLGVVTNCFIIKKSGRSGKAYLASLVDAFTSLITIHSPSRFQKMSIKPRLALANHNKDTEEGVEDSAVVIEPTAPNLYPGLRIYNPVTPSPSSRLM